MINKIVSSRKMNCTLILPCICLLALISIQCSRREDRAQRDASTVTVYKNADERLLGPAVGDNSQFLMFCSIWNFKRDIVEPAPAERWERSEDCRTWTFYLRRDVRWHDGVPFTAHDVKFSLELFAHPAVLWGGGNDLWINMESVTVLDESTITVTHKQPRCDYFPDDWNIFYPKHLLEDLDPKGFYSWDFWTHPIGNGPFRYVRHVPKIMMELEANPDFYKGKPKIERLVFKLGGGDPLIELMSGNVDVVEYFNPDDIPNLPADGRFRVNQSFNPYYHHAIYWNHRHPLFRDTKIRRALTMAINRRELAQVLNFPENTPIFDGTCFYDQFVRGEPLESLPYDPERAKQLLEEAGWRDRDGDGIRERDGEDARFTAIAANTASAVYVQAQLLRVGIQMEVRPLAIAVLRVRLQAGEFEAAFDRFSNFPSSMRRDKWFSPDSPIGYSNPQIVKLLQAFKDVAYDSEFEAQNQLCRELNPIFQAEIPVTFLCSGVRTNIVHRRIRWPDANFGALEDAWVEEEK